MKYITSKADLKTFLKEHSILIEYSRDKFGNKDGVVVSIAKGVVGFSKVHREDFVYERAKNFPNYQKFRQNFIKLCHNEQLIRDFQKMENSLNSFLYFSIVPNFDRYIALKIAINRAISGTDMKNVPFSLRDQASKMLIRSKAYFK